MCLCERERESDRLKIDKWWYGHLVRIYSELSSRKKMKMKEFMMITQSYISIDWFDRFCHRFNRILTLSLGFLVFDPIFVRNSVKTKSNYHICSRIMNIHTIHTHTLINMDMQTARATMMEKKHTQKHRRQLKKKRPRRRRRLARLYKNLISFFCCIFSIYSNWLIDFVHFSGPFIFFIV